MRLLLVLALLLFSTWACSSSSSSLRTLSVQKVIRLCRPESRHCFSTFFECVCGAHIYGPCYEKSESGCMSSECVCVSCFPSHVWCGEIGKCVCEREKERGVCVWLWNRAFVKQNSSLRLGRDWNENDQHIGDEGLKYIENDGSGSYPYCPGITAGYPALRPAKEKPETNNSNISHWPKLKQIIYFSNKVIFLTKKSNRINFNEHITW